MTPFRDVAVTAALGGSCKSHPMFRSPESVEGPDRLIEGPPEPDGERLRVEAAGLGASPAILRRRIAVLDKVSDQGDDNWGERRFMPVPIAG